jgi:hypothetical protein
MNNKLILGVSHAHTDINTYTVHARYLVSGDDVMYFIIDVAATPRRRHARRPAHAFKLSAPSRSGSGSGAGSQSRSQTR